MKGLRKYLAPFAPDQSGASAVLSDLGGILVICDAGGCAGNICGFDEPRWFMKKSAIFSAGLRDMDAILGRDDRLVEKLADTAAKIDAGFAAIIGTPVPAVIGTDYQALKRMAEKKVALPVMTVDANGMELYDAGAKKAWLELFKTFATESFEVEPGRIGILGATPLDVGRMEEPLRWEKAFEKEGKQAVCYGMGAGIDAVKRASSVEKNLVMAPAALQAAKYLKRQFGTPYEVVYPFMEELFAEKLADSGLDFTILEGKKVLIMHQQVLADSLRRVIREKAAGTSCQIVTWFSLEASLKEEGDRRLTEEDAFVELVEKEQYDVIIGDEILKNAIRGFKGTYINLPHFAVSGKV